jgi:hypothetical protein
MACAVYTILTVLVGPPFGGTTETLVDRTFPMIITRRAAEAIAAGSSEAHAIRTKAAAAQRGDIQGLENVAGIALASDRMCSSPEINST